MAAAWSLILSLLLLASCDVVLFGRSSPTTCAPVAPPPNSTAVYPQEVDLLQFAFNFEFLEGEFFLFGALGCGFDCAAPEMASGGPPPVGGMKANLDETTRRIIEELGYQEIGNMRAIKSTVQGIPRPLLNLSASNFASIMDKAFGYRLIPPFDPYASSIHYLLASYFLPYMGVVAAVGAIPQANGYTTKTLLAGVLGVEAGQDAIIRALLYQHKDEYVLPYKFTVAEFTVKISALRNRLAGCNDTKDEGLVVPKELGAEGKISSNIISADRNSLSYSRTPAEILRVFYLTGDERKPGGFFPKGANGKLAEAYLS